MFMQKALLTDHKETLIEIGRKQQYIYNRETQKYEPTPVGSYADLMKEPDVKFGSLVAVAVIFYLMSACWLVSYLKMICTDITSRNKPSADTQKIVAQLNPFLAGAPPAQFVANCLCCGAIVWYNEREEKVCNSGKSRYCHDLLLDACDPETGAPDPDYALTKKARKKKRRAREERESMAAATSGPANGMHGKDEEGEDVQSRPTAASASLTAARARAERLVGFDKNRSARSEVYDDQSDYFQDASSSWLSPEEREAAQAMGEAKRKEAEDEKRNVRVTFDFAGRRVVEIVEEAGALEGGQAGGGDHNNNAWRKPGDQGAEVLGRVAGAGKSVPAAAAAGAVPDMESSDDFPVGAMPKSNALFGRAATIYAGLVERMRERAEDAAAAENKGGDGGES